MVNLNVWLPQIREKWEANSLEIFHRLVDVEDPFVLPLDPQVHGEGDAGLLVTDLSQNNLDQHSYPGNPVTVSCTK